MSKKRVASIKGLGKNDGKDVDFVSSIIKDMDSNYSVQSNNFNSCGSCSTQKSRHDLAPSTSKDPPRNPDYAKPKKFTATRKCPLMEKSKKVLKTLRHNQLSIPKMRAHLSSFELSKKKEVESIEKKNRCKQGVNKSKPSTVPKNTAQFIEYSKNIARIKNSSVNTNYSVNNIDSKNRKRKDLNSNSVAKHNSNNNSVVKESSKELIDYNYEDYSTDDNEYEKFIKKNKKRLSHRKKSKKQKVSHSSSKSRRKYNIESDSEIDTMDCNTLSKASDNHVVDASSDNLLMDSSPDNHIVDSASDNHVVDTSSDSDNPDDSRFNVQYNIDYNLSVDNSMANICSESVSRDSCREISNDPLASNSYFEPNNLDTSLIINNSTGKKTINQDSSVLSPSREEDDTMTSINQNTNQSDHEESDLEIIEIVGPKQGENGASAKADNKCDSSGGFLANNSRNKTFQEVKTQKDNSQGYVGTNDFHSNKILLENTDGKQKRKDCVKYEAAYNTDVCKVSNSEIDCKVKDMDSRSELKEIKKENSDDDVIIDYILPAKNVNKRSRSGDGGTSKATAVLVKTEMPNFSCVAENAKYSVDTSSNKHRNSLNLNNPISKSENYFIDLTDEDNDNTSSCKTLEENKHFTQKDLKLYEVACSNLAHTDDAQGKLLKELKAPVKQQDKSGENSDIKQLLLLFKQEFQVYQDIVETEANVEASLKVLETRQAEKLKNIRSLIQEHVEGKQYIGEDDNLKIDINNLETKGKLHIPSELVTGDLKNSFSPKPQRITGVTDSFLPNFHSSISPQAVALPPAVGKDVKPDLSVLNQHIAFQHSLAEVKCEPTMELPNASETNTIRLLGERCNVCGKEAMAACQRCAKVFFCSNECGMKFWNDGHENECGK